MHDLWHVTTGYGRDALGELSLLAFTYAQEKNRGIGAIVLYGYRIMGKVTKELNFKIRSPRSCQGRIQVRKRGIILGNC